MIPTRKQYFERQRGERIAQHGGAAIECWVCVPCGLAFPADHREMVLGAGAGGTGNFHWHASGGNGQVVRVGKLWPRAAAELCRERYQRRD